MTLHSIEPNEHTLHGYFSAELAPVLTIEPGDTVRFRTLDAGWGLEPPEFDVAKRSTRRQFPRPSSAHDGHALCGPVAIKGAEPGMTLAIRIDAVRPATWGWTWAGGWPSKMNDRLDIADHNEQLLAWTLELDASTGRNQYGHMVSLHPFMGVMGVAPPETGTHSTVPPRRWGGNIDCKELVAGSTLYLPVGVSGALFSTGDGHAAQGDGEVGGQAIECPMDQVDLTFTLRDDLPLDFPQAETPNSWITFGFHEDLYEASAIALEAMIQVIIARYQLSRKEALALASIVVDMRVTQLVNETFGVHAVLANDAVR